MIVKILVPTAFLAIWISIAVMSRRWNRRG